jgi:hypothetical protein
MLRARSVLVIQLDTYLNPTHLGRVVKSVITHWAIRVPLTLLKLYLRDTL